MNLILHIQFEELVSFEQFRAHTFQLNYAQANMKHSADMTKTVYLIIIYGNGIKTIKQIHINILSVYITNDEWIFKFILTSLYYERNWDVYYYELSDWYYEVRVIYILC